MHHIDGSTLRRLVRILAGLVILKVTAVVILKYGSYFPPDFGSDFLRGREAYFPGTYQWAFYTHIVSAPVTLILGLILVSETVRRQAPGLHRCLGRIQVALVLLLVTPSGLSMAFHAAAGPVAAIGLAVLAIATGVCAGLGVSFAMRRRFTDHRRWMWRCYLLLCSAVVLRLIVGLAIVTGFTADWVDPLAIWMSWLVPLAVFELWDRSTVFKT